MSQQGKYIKANNINTFYLEEGQGAPVILIHGGGAGANGWGNWHRCIPLFAQEFHVLVPDMVGFGQTEKPEPANFTYSQDARVDHVIGFIEALGLKDVVLIGNSMGGATSMGVCMKRPELVSKLILMGSAGLNAEITDALKPVLNYDFTPEGMIRLIKVLANKNFEIPEDMVQYRWKNSIDEGAKKLMQLLWNGFGNKVVFIIQRSKLPPSKPRPSLSMARKIWLFPYNMPIVF